LSCDATAFSRTLDRKGRRWAELMMLVMREEREGGGGGHGLRWRSSCWRLWGRERSVSVVELNDDKVD